jgi:integrase
VWEVRAESGRDPVTGRRRQISRTVRGSKRDAEKVLNALVADTDRGENLGADATFEALTDRWLEQAGPDLSPTTLRRYRDLLRLHILPGLGPVPIHKIRTVDLDRLYVGLVTDRGLSPASVRQVHAIIRRALRQAVRWGWIATNPAAEASPPRVRKPDVAPPDVAQVGELLRHANEHQPELGRFLHLAATTGARRGELCALRWENIDRAASALTIGRAIVAIQGGLVEKDTKTHAARRIALDPGTLAVLDEHLAAAEARAHAAEVDLPPTAYLFSAEPDGSIPWTPTTVTKWFRSTCDALGIDKVRLHDLRHFAATRLLAAGVPVRTVSGRLGHANAATTLTVYAHFLEASDQAAADVMGALVAPDAK